MGTFIPRFLRHLRDVDESGVADGDSLTYDSGTETWVPAAGGGGGGPPTGAAGGVLDGTYPNPGFDVDMATQAELDAHVSDITDAHDATAISVAPFGTIAATQVQAALEEIVAEAISDLGPAVILAPASSARNRIVSTAEGVVPLTLETLDPGANFEWVLRLIGPDGDLGGFDSAGGLSLTFRDGDGALIIDGIAGMLGPLLQAAVQTFNNGRYSGIDKRARLYTGASEAVADGDVDGPGYVHMWFDSTDGDAKFLWKGKTLDGTAVSGELPVLSSGGAWRRNAGSPEGVVTAPIGVLYLRSDGGGGTTLYIKESGAGNTGWVAVGGSSGAPSTATYITTAADAGLSAEKVLGTTVIASGTLAARPAAAVAGYLYFATDVNGGTLYRDTGAAWVQVGTGQNGRMPPALVCWTGHPGPALAGGVGALNTANRAQGHRVIVPKTGTLVDVHVYIPTSSGNIEVGILDTTATTRNRLWTTGSIASPGTGWQDMGDPNLSVTEGDQLDFYVNADNTTVTFDRILSAAVLGHVVLPAAFFPAAGGGKPTVIWQGPAATFPLASTLAEASMGGFAIAPCVIARVS